MNVIEARIGLFVRALWWGSLSVMGPVVVPMLFYFLPSKALAGPMAARVFAAQVWLGLVCGVILLLLEKKRAEKSTRQGASPTLALVALAMLLALLLEFAVAPRIVMRENLIVWHNLGLLLYAGQWASVTALMWMSSHNPNKEQMHE